MAFLVDVAITANTVNDLIEQANTAIAASSWAAALNLLFRAKAALVAIPNGGAGDASMQYDRNAIDSLIEEVKQQQASSSPTTSASADSNSSIRYGRVQYQPARGGVGVDS